jgi:hypothetical protein
MGLPRKSMEKPDTETSWQRDVQRLNLLYLRCCREISKHDLEIAVLVTRLPRPFLSALATAPIDRMEECMRNLRIPAFAPCIPRPALQDLQRALSDPDPESDITEITTRITQLLVAQCAPGATNKPPIIDPS